VKAGAWGARRLDAAGQREADPAPLKVAIVGAGGWGGQHARVFAARPDVELCAVASRRPERAQARAAEWGIRPYTSVTEMIETEHPDLVSLSLPNEEHFEATMTVIEAGVPLLAEKPLVFSIEQADALLDAAAARELFFAINFNHRYAEPVRRALAAISSGQLGDLVFATWRFGGEPGTGPHPHANLIETQCHGLDMLEFLCGPIASVMAQLTSKTGRGWSTIAVALKFANGAVGNLTGSYDSSYAYPDTHSVEVNGTDGRLLIEDTVKRFTLSRAGDETRQVWEAGYFNDTDRDFHATFDKHVDALLQALRVGDPPPVPATAGRRALELAQAIITSFESGRRVEVPVPGEVAMPS
jgi:myo-inositol 2-dehydrogenase / D-chiro-inositol 1-dehydrogenase